MGLSLLAGCANEKQQIFKEAEKDLEQGSALSFFDDITARAGCPGEIIPWGTDEKNEETTDNPSDTTTGETL